MKEAVILNTLRPQIRSTKGFGYTSALCRRADGEVNVIANNLQRYISIFNVCTLVPSMMPQITYLYIYMVSVPKKSQNRRSSAYKASSS